MPYVNQDMRRENVLPVWSAPLGDRSKQTHWKGEENIAPSVVDPYFEQHRELGKLDPQFQYQAQIGRIVNGILYALPHEANIISNEAAFLTQHAQSLRDHLDARMGAVFRQLVDLYGQPYTCEIGSVEDQLESSTALQWYCAADGRQGWLSFQSAHYGTLPCVVAYPRDAYTAWAQYPQAYQKPAGHVVGKYCDTYHANNACAGHLTVVNQADSLMDWQGSQDVIIRPFTLSLLNASAAQQIDPLSGMRLFIGKLSMTVDTLLATRREPSYQIIFQAYREHLAYIRTMIEQNPHGFFKLLLGVEINDDHPLVHKLRTIIYPHRFTTLQTISGCQSQIAVRINAIKDQIIAGQRRSPNFDKAFKAFVVLHATQHSERMGKIFQRYFCTNYNQALQAWNECNTQRGHSQAQIKCFAALGQVQALFNDVNKLMHNYSIDVSLLRANLLRQLRHLNYWSQALVSYKVNLLGPSERMYHQKLSRMELGQKKISESFADIFSNVFGMHRSVFISDAPYT